ncbi:MAG: MBL fold metallo-hydrolase [Proteobacteria bacterium]|nr:MBL fold metallo-hydrolase [Pseudomonadota bacterium]
MDRRSFLGGLALAPVTITTLAQAGQDRLFTVSDGSFSLPASMLNRGRKPEEIKAALGGAESYISQLNITVLERAEGFTVFDCGAGANFIPGAGKLMESLKAAGVEAEKVKHLVFTHAHPDHLWGSLDDFGAPAFPNATFHVSQGEYDFWHRKDILNLMPEDRQVFATGAQRHFKELTPVLKQFKPEQEILPGLFAAATPGHTPGHVSYDVKMGSEIITVAGDALTHPILSFAYPEWAGGFDHEADVAAATRKKLLDRLASEKRMMVGYHLPSGGRGRVEKAGAAYRFISG